MRPTDALRAFDAYMAVRDRLPSARFPARFATAPSLAEIAAPFDLVLLDAYGVLNIGETAIPGAAERVAALRQDGKKVMVVSNSAGYPKRLMMRRYATLGFDFTDSEVATSREALLRQLAGQPDCRWGLMLNPRHGLEEFEEIETSFLADDRTDYDRVDGFLLIGSEGWTESRQAMLQASLSAKPRPVLVGNPDIVAPREDGLSLEPGHFAHRLANATGIAPVFLGKPFDAIFDIALSRLSPRPEAERVLMVGDTLHTDILGGRHLGFATALVTDFGSLAGTDAAEAISRSGIVPDFVINRI
ncbi:MAG: HAD-IIA family hydrolase [Paracoccaceae bacterium]